MKVQFSVVGAELSEIGARGGEVRYRRGRGEGFREGEVMEQEEGDRING